MSHTKITILLVVLMFFTSINSLRFFNQHIEHQLNGGETEDHQQFIQKLPKIPAGIKTLGAYKLATDAPSQSCYNYLKQLISYKLDPPSNMKPLSTSRDCINFRVSPPSVQKFYIVAECKLQPSGKSFVQKVMDIRPKQC